MPDPTPPFSALRVVEAASRHRSFTWAARELNITHSAVSQSIRRLEADLGIRLFERRGGEMEPSEAAFKLAQSYSDAAQSLSQIIRDVSGDRDLGVLTVAMPADVARLWFASRMGRLGEAMPDVQITISTGSNEGREPELELLIVSKLRPIDQSLADAPYFPVCSPAFAERHALDSPRSIMSAPLVGDASEAWSTWVARFAPGESTSRPNLFDEPALMLDAAAQGAGVALTHMFLAEPYLASGELRMLPFLAPSGQQLVLRSRIGASKVEFGERFAMWLKLELARSAALLRRAIPTP